MKTCCDCKTTKPFDQFVAKPSCRDGYEPRCRVCRSIRYNKSTPGAICKKIYNSQCTNSMLRGHKPPDYTLAEFTAWAISQPNLTPLCMAWEKARYFKDLAPSADRIDNNLPYTLSNIQLMTWKENRDLAAQAKVDNEFLVNHRAVTAYNKDGSVHKTYASMAEAMREFGGKPSQSWGISSVCNGTPVKGGDGRLYTPRTYKGFTWKWA
jgi:hypothetical protein